MDVSPATLTDAEPPIFPVDAVIVAEPVPWAITIPALPGELLTKAAEELDVFQCLTRD